jgi:uncharacterized membrane protein YqjE
MLHPVFTTLIQRPDLVAGHVTAYAALIAEEAGAAGHEVVMKVMAYAITLVAGLLFIGLTGIALMLGAVQGEFHWALVAVPGVALLAAVLSFAWAKKPLKSDRFPQVREQMESDARALRMVTQ